MSKTSRIWSLKFDGQVIERFEFPEPVTAEYANSVLHAAELKVLTWMTTNHDPGDEDERER